MSTFGHKITATEDSEGVVTCTSDAVGGMNIIIEPITTLFDPNVTLTGMAGIVQHVFVGAVCNAVGVKAKTGNWGLAVTEKLAFTIGE